jgi:acetyltransferase AlgX (SGNH hydrolase-like protein)
MANSPGEGGAARRRARRALSVVLGLLCGVGIAEAVFSLRDQGAFPHLNVYRADAQYGARLRPGASTKVRFGGAKVSTVSIHAGGYRGRDAGAEPPNSPGEVLFVGDSQTFGLGVEERETFAARFAERAKRPVYNAGVPTWGPPEFLRAIRELGKRRHPASVVYVVNFANDPFEAERPNAQRHAVWDGWAVRRENAPAHLTHFPGRELLFRSSHLVFALRQWWHHRYGPYEQSTERGMPSEGTFRDLFRLGQEITVEQLAARAETERRAALYETEATYAQESYRLAESRVRALVWKEMGLGIGESAYDGQSHPSTVYLAADANPGDIVSPGVGEEGRPVFATAVYIRQAVELRNRFEAELTKRAKAALDTDEAKKILSALSERDQERVRLAAVRAKPLELVRSASPLTRMVLQAKQETEALGARFVLLALPLDVMVSEAEWPKHGDLQLDLAPAKVLIQDLVESVRDAGGVTLDASAALAAAEPGAFLPGDLHMTPKGHDAVARALIEALENSERPASPPQLALERGRSRVPPPEVWTKLGGEVAVNGSAGCPVTKKYREWLYIRCVPARPSAPQAVGLEVVQGGLGDALSWVHDGEMTLVAPIPSGSGLEAIFSWSDGKSKRLRVVWDAAGAAPEMTMTPDAKRAKAPGDANAAERVCACYQSVHPGATCGAIIANADVDCVKTYDADCQKLLACAQGDALSPPRCARGFSNAGASLHCLSGAVPTPPVVVAVDASAVKPSAPPPELHAAAETLVKSAQAFVGPGCRLGADDIELISIVPYDRCPTDAPTVFAYDEAWKVFDSLASRAPQQGPAATFREKAYAFGSFIKAALASGDTRGTAAFLQDLALAHNAWLPDAPMPVDAPRIVALYFGLSGIPKTDYFRNLRKDGEKRKAAFEASGKHFLWRRGPNGFEGPYLEGDSRTVGGYSDVF